MSDWSEVRISSSWTGVAVCSTGIVSSSSSSSPPGVPGSRSTKKLPSRKMRGRIFACASSVQRAPALADAHGHDRALAALDRALDLRHAADLDARDADRRGGAEVVGRAEGGLDLVVRAERDRLREAEVDRGHEDGQREQADAHVGEPLAAAAGAARAHRPPVADSSMSAYAPVSGHRRERLAGRHARASGEGGALEARRARVTRDQVVGVVVARVALDEAALAGLAVGQALGRDRAAVGLVLGELGVALDGRSCRWPARWRPSSPGSRPGGRPRWPSRAAQWPSGSSSEKCSAR